MFVLVRTRDVHPADVGVIDDVAQSNNCLRAGFWVGRLEFPIDVKRLIPLS